MLKRNLLEIILFVAFGLGIGYLFLQLLEKNTIPADEKERLQEDPKAIFDAAMLGQAGRAGELLKDKPALVRAKDGGGGTPLHTAAFYKRGEVARVLLQHDADLAARNRAGQTALHIAAERGAREVVRCLLQHKAQVDAVDGQKRTPLHVAAAAGHNEIVRLLLAHNADLQAKDGEGETPLYKAVYGGWKEVVKALLAKHSDVNAKSNKGYSPLLLAASCGYDNLAVLLLAHGAKFDFFSAAALGDVGRLTELLKKAPQRLHARLPSGETPLYFAAEGRRLKALDLLIKKGAEINTKSHGATLLQRAVSGGRLEVAEKLIAAGAELDIFSAAALGRLKTLENLLKVGSSQANAKDEWRKATPLHWALIYSQLEAARLLLKYKADVNARDASGLTPLHKATARGHTKFMALLLEHGADPALRSNPPLAVTALHVAALQGRCKAAGLLLKHKANPNLTDGRGETPLHFAIKKGRRDIVELLLKHGLDRNKKLKGLSYLQFALLLNQKKIALLLSQYGVRK